MYKTLIICFFLLTCPFTQLYANDLEHTETELYEEAVKLYDQKKYKQAIRAFQKIEDLYPLSYWAMKAKLLSGVSYYNMGTTAVLQVIWMIIYTFIQMVKICHMYIT